MDNSHMDRQTLKSYFKKGRIPTEEQFAALIDSLHNIREDGCLKVTGSDGLILLPFQGGKTVATVYTEKPESPDAAPLWRIATGEGGTLEILNGKGDAVLVLGQEGIVTVPGEMKAGRYLSDKEEETSPEDDGVFRINADGHWHDLPVEYADNGRGSDGCRVYRFYDARSGSYVYFTTQGDVTSIPNDSTRRQTVTYRQRDRQTVVKPATPQP